MSRTELSFCRKLYNYNIDSEMYFWGQRRDQMKGENIKKLDIEYTPMFNMSNNMTDLIIDYISPDRGSPAPVI